MEKGLTVERNFSKVRLYISVGYLWYIVFLAAVAVIITGLLHKFVGDNLFIWWEKSAIIYFSTFYAFLWFHLTRKKEKGALMYRNGRQFLYRLTVDWIIYLVTIKILRLMYWLSTGPLEKAISLIVYYIPLSFMMTEYVYNVLDNTEEYYYARPKEFEPKYKRIWHRLLAVIIIAELICASGLHVWHSFLVKILGAEPTVLPAIIRIMLCMGLWGLAFSSILIVYKVLSKWKMVIYGYTSLYITGWIMLVFVFYSLVLMDILVIISGQIVNQWLYVFREIYTILFILFVGSVYKFQVNLYKKYSIPEEL